jgi:MFS family permease
MSAASLAGPLVGGVLIDQVGWRAFRFVLFALMALGAIMVFMGVKATKEQVKDMAVESDKLDYAGAVAVMALLIGIIIPLSMVSYIPMGSLGSNALFALAVVGLVALILIIRKKKDAAIIPSSVITDRNTIAFALCNFFANFSAMGIMFFIPGYVMRVLFADPLVVSIGPALAAGVTTMLIAALGLVLGPVFGKMIARAGDAKPVIIIGVIARVVVMVAFLFLLNPETPVWIIYIIMFVAGVYNSQNTIAFSAGPQIQLDPSKRVLSNGVIQMGQNIGSGVAMAIFTFLLVAGPVAAMTPMLIISLVMTGFLLVSALLLKKRTPEQSES